MNTVEQNYDQDELLKLDSGIGVEKQEIFVWMNRLGKHEKSYEEGEFQLLDNPLYLMIPIHHQTNPDKHLKFERAALEFLQILNYTNLPDRLNRYQKLMQSVKENGLIDNRTPEDQFQIYLILSIVFHPSDNITSVGRVRALDFFALLSPLFRKKQTSLKAVRNFERLPFTFCTDTDLQEKRHPNWYNNPSIQTLLNPPEKERSTLINWTKFSRYFLSESPNEYLQMLLLVICTDKIPQEDRLMALTCLSRITTLNESDLANVLSSNATFLTDSKIFHGLISLDEVLKLKSNLSEHTEQSVNPSQTDQELTYEFDFDIDVHLSGTVAHEEEKRELDELTEPENADNLSQQQFLDIVERLKKRMARLEKQLKSSERSYQLSAADNIDLLAQNAQLRSQNYDLELENFVLKTFETHDLSELETTALALGIDPKELEGLTLDEQKRYVKFFYRNQMRIIHPDVIGADKSLPDKLKAILEEKARNLTTTYKKLIDLLELQN